jgi:molecular chaperone DnaJ
VRSQQGFFTVARTCPQCRGAGRMIAKPCATCRGAGRVTRERKITVKVPAGIATGQQLRMQGEGEGGSAGGPPGNLFVVIHVQEHEFFRRDGVNLFCEIPVNYPTVTLGGEIDVPTLDGSEKVKVPEGTQTGTTLRLRGKGMPDVNGRGRGDLFATVQVTTPKKLNKEQRHAVEQLAKTLPKEGHEPRKRHEESDERNLFDRVKDMFG